MPGQRNTTTAGPNTTSRGGVEAVEAESFSVFDQSAYEHRSFDGDARYSGPVDGVIDDGEINELLQQLAADERKGPLIPLPGVLAPYSKSRMALAAIGAATGTVVLLVMMALIGFLL